MLTCLAPLAADLVITGQDKNEIGVLVFPNRDALLEAGYELTDDNGVLNCKSLLAEITRRLSERDQQASGSSSRVTRALFMTEPPSVADAEITAKGNLNFRKVLTRRADLLSRLYNDNDPAVARV